MPSSTILNTLKINKLSEAQFDAAVQQGVIGANDLSLLIDADNQSIQVDTLPTAGASELGNIYQFVGATDQNYTNGYFYKCVSDGQSTPTYSWTQISVQPAGSSLPSQTGNAGKFLTTDGTDASWGDAKDIEWAVENSTTFSQIHQWYEAGKLVLCKVGMRTYQLISSQDTGMTPTATFAYIEPDQRSIWIKKVVLMGGWTSYSYDMQAKIPAGTSGNVLTYTGTAGSVGSTALATVATTGAYSDLTGTPTIDQTYNASSTNAQSGTAVAGAISAAISTTYKAAGSVAFASKPSLSSSIEGYVYNISDAFTTTSDFVEGAGNSYPAGTNIVCINTASSGTAVYKWDVLSGFVDLSGYQPLLVSGTSIKTVNNSSILGSGNIDTFPSQSGNNGKFLSTDGSGVLWSNIPTELPSQTGNSGKFLTTDGTDASWGNALVNNTTQINSLAIGTGSITSSSSLGCGISAQALGNATTSVGYNAYAGGNYSIAIGSNAKADANAAIQISSNISVVTNSDANTFKVANNNGNFEIMSADGTVPADRLKNAINKYSTMPTAASTNLGWIVQYTGTTNANYTHGYIYECVSDGGNPATYSWTQTNVQPAGGGSSLPSQTGNAGKFLTTDGTDASWATINALQNTATGTDSLTILGTATSFSSAVNVGIGSQATSVQGTALGKSSHAGQRGVACGYQASATIESSVALGPNMSATALCATQLGGSGVTGATNSDANTFKVANLNGNYEMMSANGTIPTDRYTTTPSSDGNYVPTLSISSGTATRSWTSIASSVSSSSTNAETVGAKLFYDTVGDIVTLINAL